MSNATSPSTEDLVDRCIEAQRSGGDVGAILRQHPETAGEVRPLLELAAELEALPGPEPSASAMMNTLVRLSLRGGEAPTAPKPRLFSRPVLARAAAIFVCVLLLGWGTVAASSGAMPGDLLYPVKLLTERVQFFLTVTPEARAELRIVFSEERLKEAVKRHQADGKIDRDLLRAMLNEAERALDAGAELPDASRGLLFSRVAYLSDRQKGILEELKARVGPDEQQALAPFIEACDEQCGRMCEMMGCGKRDDGAGSRPICTCPTCRRRAEP